MKPFIPGLELCEAFHREVVAPLLAEHLPSLPYTSARIGHGSEVLGFDTARSMDHHWGPRLQLFLAEEDLECSRLEVLQRIAEHLPGQFRGFPNALHGRRDRRQSYGRARGASGAHGVEVTSLAEFLVRVLGRDPRDGLDAVDWLLLPQQKLRSLTTGRVFADPRGDLAALRARLEWYPEDLWRYLIASQWQNLAQEEAFLGRCGEVGDDLGSRLVAARLVEGLMRLGFLLERQYAPYAKWFGSAFAGLDLAGEVSQPLRRTLAAVTWQERQAALGEVFEALARRQNALALVPELSPQLRYFHDRPFLVLDSWRFADALFASIRCPQVGALPRPLGGIDQLSGSTDLRERPELGARLAPLYRPEPRGDGGGASPAGK